ncbi:casein kinase II subunit beta-2-like [Argentina anserina]|uniref:casein kinase II subunit beta-2-like n=1 Tax=Argentina anserina TaxID=57926 RepID=UPI0021762E7C|nr:casein kinase II subunit beta-2-like [Potentilla anserina]
MHKRKENHHHRLRGVVRSHSEPALKDKASSTPSTSFAVVENYNNNHLFYEEGESETSCDDAEVRRYDDEEDSTWISWFCNQKGNEFFCEVDEDYILDDFNPSGLRNQVPFYDYALDTILDVESSDIDGTDNEQNNLIESAAEMLYGLIHARYIVTTRGITQMLDNYRNYDFGRCPRVNCSKQRCLPVGESDTPRLATVKIYCPKCEDIYSPQSRHQEQIDGAYFGTTFPHLFFLTNGHLKPQKASQSYAPRIYGFKVHKK